MIKNLIIKKVSVSMLKAPLNQPFRTALGQHDSLENVLLSIQTDSGIKGFGEAAVATHITGETISETIKNLVRIKKDLMGRQVNEIYQLSQDIKPYFRKNKAGLAAVEMAVFDALAKAAQLPLWKLFGSKCAKFQTDITVVIADLKETEDSIKKYYKQGFRTFKVKIGRDFDLDVKRVLAIKYLTRNCRFYLDANQGYDADMTLSFVKILRKFKMKPDVIEQPTSKNDWDGLKKVSRLSGSVVCADESASSLDDVKKIVKGRFAQAVNVKFMKTGIVEARAIAYYAKSHGLKLMIGGMMESPLAMLSSAHLAAGLGFFDYIDLDTPFFLKQRLRQHAYLSSKGTYDLRKIKAGVGIDPL